MHDHLKYKNLQPCSLIQKNQFVDSYTVLSYLEAITLNSLEPIAPKIQHNSFLRSVKDIFKFYDYVLVEKDNKLVGILTRQDYNQALSMK